MVMSYDVVKAEMVDKIWIYRQYNVPTIQGQCTCARLQD